MLVDEIWRTTKDEDSDIDWYVKRTVLGGIYSTTEIYMLTPRVYFLNLLKTLLVSRRQSGGIVFGRSCSCRNGEFIARICRQSVREMKKS
ncbi:uncharacterized protein LOC105792944 isoform X1 [Gossypium raimondii]|uniref:uncharacterized protein LOC105792944 isoform X1 n=1 Tax=Gossypium raimondii TaxID=29730 RepID=UPI00227B1C52|nr:uncharacterized protein LOC105792944 isoform X1 [Gossypium raimondii]